MIMSRYFGYDLPRPQYLNGRLWCPDCKGVYFFVDYNIWKAGGHSALWIYVQHMKDTHGYTRGL